MRNFELLAVGIRLVGIYAAFKGLQFMGISYSSINQMSSFAPETDTTTITTVYVFLIISYFIMVAFLIVKPNFFAKKLLPKNNEKELLTETPAPCLEVAAFTVLGVYIIVLALPELLNDASRLWHVTQKPQLYSESSNSILTTNLCISAFQLCIGVYLCLQASGLRKLIYKLREFGHK